LKTPTGHPALDNVSPTAGIVTPFGTFGRTLEAYRHDLRGFFQWAADNHLEVLKATRPHIELFRAWMEDRQLAASTIDRRLSTVCGFYR
jgi:site-specific recombinase XerD